MTSDLELLQGYVRERLEEPFAALVGRHLNLVYSAALRQVRSPELAEEVAQSVFTDLARNAQRLAPDTILTAWLYQVTRRTAIDVVRREARRQLREQISCELTAMNTTAAAADWTHIEPILDEAMQALEEADRTAVLLRFFENRSLREVGQTLGVSEDAAQKRVTRAVERLREFFAKRGVGIGVGGLGVVISANAIQAAPAGLFAAISTTAAASIGTTAATATKAIAMSTLQKIVVTAVIATAIGMGIYEARQVSKLRRQVETLRRLPPAGSANEAALAALRDQVELLTDQNVALTQALTKANADKARLETERGQARHSAAVYKELAKQAVLPDKNSTNEYPTMRHAMAGLGRMARLAAELNKQKEGGLSPEEKAANEAARMAAMTDMIKLVKTLEQFETAKEFQQSAPEEDRADTAACVLYGALNLNEQQFGEVYGLMHKYQEEATQKGLMDKSPTPENEASLKQLNEQARAELQNILTPEQAGVFATIEKSSPEARLIAPAGTKNLTVNF